MNNKVFYAIPLLICIAMLLVFCTIRVDCMNREYYWNAKGIFVDCWDCNTWFICDYPEIPKDINTKSN